MKKTFLLFMLSVLLVLCGCSGSIKKQQIALEEIKQGIVDYENKRLPLFLQEHSEIHSIVIDSLVIINDVEPYAGYLSTTWDFDQKQDQTAHQWAANGYKDKYVRKTMNVLVEVSDITTHEDDTYTWATNWFGAFYQVYMD